MVEDVAQLVTRRLERLDALGDLAQLILEHAAPLGRRRHEPTRAAHAVEEGGRARQLETKRHPARRALEVEHPRGIETDDDRDVRRDAGEDVEERLARDMRRGDLAQELHRAVAGVLDAEGKVGRSAG
jgi:ribosome-binding protein aMBF1 (putative translation factor)